ncbi:zinc finger protein 318-like [Pituophis catenifer annectens]|uniref:zinc finger protein 318-like n=1 Tax=Pituophis catenifer annectens TaxID=94852 RepID=UPI003991EF1A
MSRHESSHPAMRVQRSRFGSIDSYREGGPRSRSPSPRGHRRYHHHRSPPSRRFSHRSHRSPSPRRFSRRYSPSHYPRQRSRSPGRRSESSVEKYLRDVVENGIGTSLPADSLSNVNRDDLADGPIFSRALSHPWNLERGIFREENPSRPFSMRHDEDSYNRDIFIAQLDRSINSEFLQHQSRENKRGGEQESKYFQYDREDRLFDESIKSRALLAETEKYCKQSLNKSPSLMYMDEDFRKLERIRRKREEDLRSRNISTDYPMPDSANQGQSSESQHHYRSEKTPAVPLKSILKKRSDDSSIQDSRNFSEGKKPPESTSKSVNQRSDFLLPYEKASQDGSGFSCILGTTTDSTYMKRNFFMVMMMVIQTTVSTLKR